MSYQETGYGDILSGFQQTKTWLSEVGINTAGTRVDDIEQILVEFTRDLAKRPRVEVVDRWDWEHDPSAYYALADGEAFNRIRRALSSFPSHQLPRALLKRSVIGPLCPAEEEPTSTDARNIFLELDLGTRLMEAGIEVTGWDDVQFTFDGIEYTIQCKRPYGGKGVPRNIESARNQIRCRVRASPHLRGLIAIGVDKVYSLDRHEPGKVTDARELDQKAWRFTQRFNETFGYTWAEDQRVTGVLLVFRFLCHFLPTNRITTVGIEALAPTIRGGTKDYARLRDLASVLRTTGSP